MPKSDTWPGSVAMESMTSMDSAGSCDSVISINSGFSDDSLEYLSAEERACLMFLEETIESLEAEEDSGLFNNEHDHLPVPGSLAAKMADLSSSMGHGRLDEVSKYPCDDPVRELGMDHKPFSYLVPTPLVLANSGSNTLCKTGTVADPLPAISNCLTDLSPDRVDLVHRPINTILVSNPSQNDHRIPSEVNVVMIPPPSDFMDEPVQQEGLQEASTPLSRGVLTQDEPKTSPPAVAPKPKRLPSNIILKTHKAPIPSPVSSPDSATGHACTSPSERFMMDPQKVRMEALRKLGLLKEDEVESGLAYSPLHSPKFHRSIPSESPTSTHPPQSDTAKTLHSLTLPPAKDTLEHKSCGGYRERSRSDLLVPTRTPPANPKGGKSATLERSGSADSQDPGLPKAFGKGSPAQLRNARPRPASLGNGKDFKAIQSAAPQTLPATAAVEPGDSARSHKLPRSQGISVLITPRSKSGEERREALRKLGLLKD